MTREQNMGEEAGFQHIIQIMRQTTPVQTPDNFTERVMGLLPKHLPDSWQPNYVRILNALTEATTWTECSLCFFMAGFFYLIMGIVLIPGLKKLGDQMSVANWIMIQPQIALITAFGFLVLGVLLLKKGVAAVRMVHLCTLIYIGLAIMNGIAVGKAFGSPSVTVGIPLFMMVGILMGGFLAVVLQKYHRRVIREPG